MELSKGARCLFLASTGEEDIVGMEMLADFSTSPKLLPKNVEMLNIKLFPVSHELNLCSQNVMSYK